MDSMIYERQRRLDLDVPKKATVIGIGGIGSWVALDLVLSGVPELTLIDHDLIEDSNLNRTPFKKSQVGEKKVSSISTLIYERRDITIYPYPQKHDELDFNFPKPIIDCRDIVDSLECNVRVGYDGFSITLHFNPKPQSVWGNGPSWYETTPSWLVPPQIVSSLVTLYLCTMNYDSEKIITIDVREIFEVIENV